MYLYLVYAGDVFLLLLLCCYTAVAAAAVLLLAAAARHGVPDGNICCRFIASNPSVFFLLFIQRDFFDFFLMYPLAVRLCRIYGLDLPTSLVITGMREANAGVSPSRQSPPCIIDRQYTHRPKLIVY